jgi:hypothetical protein
MGKIYSVDMEQLLSFSGVQDARKIIGEGAPDETLEESLDRLCKDIDRESPVFNGDKESLGCENKGDWSEARKQRIKQFLTQHGFIAVLSRYHQDRSGLLSALLSKCTISKLPANIFPSTFKAQDRQGFSFPLLNDNALGLSEILYGISLSDGRTGKNSIIPGELLLRGKFSEGMSEPKSVRVSNEFLKKLLEYKPVMSEGKLTYPRLEIYGFEIINNDGKFNSRNFNAAIKQAEQNEVEAAQELDVLKESFKTWMIEKREQAENLKNIFDLTEHRRIKPVTVDENGDVQDKRASDKNGHKIAYTLDTAMATAIFRDLPLVIKGEKDIKNCPALIDAIVWCGDPDLSAAIKQALQPVIEADLEKFERLLVIYGSGDSVVDFAQVYQDVSAKDERITVEQLRAEAELSVNEVAETGWLAIEEDRVKKEISDKISAIESDVDKRITEKQGLLEENADQGNDQENIIILNSIRDLLRESQESIDKEKRKDPKKEAISNWLAIEEERIKKEISYKTNAIKEDFHKRITEEQGFLIGNADQDYDQKNISIMNNTLREYQKSIDNQKIRDPKKEAASNYQIVLSKEKEAIDKAKLAVDVAEKHVAPKISSTLDKNIHQLRLQKIATENVSQLCSEEIQAAQKLMDLSLEVEGQRIEEEVAEKVKIIRETAKTSIAIREQDIQSRRDGIAEKMQSIEIIEGEIAAIVPNVQKIKNEIKDLTSSALFSIEGIRSLSSGQEEYEENIKQIRKEVKSEIEIKEKSIRSIKEEAKDKIKGKEEAIHSIKEEIKKSEAAIERIEVEIVDIRSKSIDSIIEQRERKPKEEALSKQAKLKSELSMAQSRRVGAQTFVDMAKGNTPARIHSVDMAALRKVEENCNKAIREFGILRTVSKNKDKTIKIDLNQVFLDMNRDFSANGKSTLDMFSDRALNEIKIKDFFPKQETIDALAFGYSQGVTDLISYLGLCFRIDNERLPGISIIGVAPESSSGFTFVRDTQALNFATLTSGLKLKYIGSNGEPAGFVIPGECFVTAKTHPEGGFEFLSVRTSNKLLKAMFEYTPIRTISDGNPDVLVYPPLTVYGLKIIDESGKLNEENLKVAIIQAEKEEEIAQLTLDLAVAEFKRYCEDQPDTERSALKLMMEHVEKHSKSRDHIYGRLLVNGNDAVTLDTTMLTTIYRDLPAVLSGDKQIEDCPMLLKTIIWCGVPELTAELKAILIPKVGASELDSLLLVYGSGSEMADLAQVYQDAEKGEKEEARMNWEAAAVTERDFNIDKKITAKKITAIEQSIEHMEKELSVKDEKINDQKLKLTNETNDLNSLLSRFRSKNNELKMQNKQPEEPLALRVLKSIGSVIAQAVFVIATFGIGFSMLKDREERKKEKILAENETKKSFIDQAKREMESKGIELPKDINFNNFESKLIEKISKTIESTKRIIKTEEIECEPIVKNTNALLRLLREEEDKDPEAEARVAIAHRIAAEKVVARAQNPSISAVVVEKAVDIMDEEDTVSSLTISGDPSTASDLDFLDSDLDSDLGSNPDSESEFSVRKMATNRYSFLSPQSSHKYSPDDVRENPQYSLDDEIIDQGLRYR